MLKERGKQFSTAYGFDMLRFLLSSLLLLLLLLFITVDKSVHSMVMREQRILHCTPLSRPHKSFK